MCVGFWFQQIAHKSDVLRLAIVYKHGGVYLDIDSLVLRSLHDLRNVVTFHTFEMDSIANGALAFDKSHPFLADCLQEILLQKYCFAFEVL